MAFRAGEPVWCLAHSEEGVCGFDFGLGSFWYSSGGNAMDDEVSPSLADASRCDREFMEGLLKDGQVCFVGVAHVL